MTFLDKPLVEREADFNLLTVDQALRDLYDPDSRRLRYPLLKRNLVYYANQFQFEHGDLFRAILGREVLYDAELEESLVKCLDAIYHQLMDNGNYTLKSYRCIRKGKFILTGTAWENGVPCSNFIHAKRQTGSLRGRDIVYVRRDLTQQPERADIEFYDRRRKRVSIISLPLHKWDYIAHFHFRELKDQRKLWEFSHDEARRALQTKIYT